MMHHNNSNGSGVASARGLTALFIMLAMGLGLMASAEAAPLAYVTNTGSNTVSVIDTATNSVVATVAVGLIPRGVAVTPDGKHTYVANGGDPGTVSVIETAGNTVVATVPVGSDPFALAVTPDGKHVYVAISNLSGTSNNVSVIDTATNTVVATVPVGTQPFGVGIGVVPPGQSCDNAFSACVNGCPDAGDCPGEPPQAERKCLQEVMQCFRSCVAALKRCTATCK
jgi:YVTN family beta-propeller protein